MDIQVIDDEQVLETCTHVFVEAFAAEPWNEVWPADTVRARLGEVLAVPRSVGLTAVHDGQCVGFLVGYLESFHPVDRFQLAEMAVRPDRQGHGVGTGLVRELLDRLAMAGVGEVYLITSRGESPEAFWNDRSFVSSRGRVVMVALAERAT
ncbi:MAG TPA: GNAT family N-acetyltransferase [Nitriliruptorales bacterium]